MKKFSDTIGNLTRALPACSAVLKVGPKADIGNVNFTILNELFQ
jgi:hypothetical protein